MQYDDYIACRKHGLLIGAAKCQQIKFTQSHCQKSVPSGIVWVAILSGGSSNSVKFPGGPLKYNSVHMGDQKNAWKGYFFHGKARNASDALRMWKTVFLEEKGTFDICLSCEMGTISFQNFFSDLYASVLNAQLD